MYNVASTVLYLLVFLTTAVSVTWALKDYVIIATNSGQVRGEVVEKGVGQPKAYISQFLGLPYAAPPIGHLRFRPPVPHLGWNRIMDVVEHGNICPQNTTLWKQRMNPEVFKARIQHNFTSEDCLFLDIYVPRNLKKWVNPAELKLPVMVYFHGGGFQQGSSMMYGGHWLAMEGDVIIVVVNYRLGVLGFLSSEYANMGGNFGLLDQLRSLEWLKDNIGHFGGDSNQVTIFGQGAGGASVSFHVLSPRSKTLFHRSISQSGVALMPNITQYNSTLMARTLTERLNCTRNTSIEEADCLRLEVDVKVLLNISRQVAEELNDQWLPVIDGDFIIGDPLSTFHTLSYNLVPYVIGVNSHDGFPVYENKLNLKPEEEVTQKILADTIRDTVKRDYEEVVDKVSKVTEMEYSTCVQNDTQRKAALVDFLTDYTIGAPSYLAATLHRVTGAVTYFYEFSQRPSYKLTNESIPSFVQASHADENDYVFGYMKYVIQNTTAEDHELSVAMMRAWTRFAKTKSMDGWEESLLAVEPGKDPLVKSNDLDKTSPGNLQNRAKWEKLTAKNENYFVFTTDLNEHSSHKKYRHVQMAFWNNYILSMRDGVCRAPPPVIVHATPNPLAAELAAANTSRTVLIVFLILFIILLVVIILVLCWIRYKKKNKKDEDPKREFSKAFEPPESSDPNHRGNHVDSSPRGSDRADDSDSDDPEEGKGGKARLLAFRDCVRQKTSACFTCSNEEESDGIHSKADDEPTENHRLRSPIEVETDEETKPMTNHATDV
ncbi:liver carboxylesterase isoform X3 [Lingula anatina]|uniref:Cytochrome c oxidase polypeptide II n=1 Tax=Lingula anatina TaxID=7574 RepID=A0A2R2MTU1_LINAN|nr:liver carboxylesterase isoform X3 [Lingula anatina]|eukprot:XP_023933659.1 liver carboxylesterase isoform X3 [Lingula anatina]